jgi:hypothetical protein
MYTLLCVTSTKVQSNTTVTVLDIILRLAFYERQTDRQTERERKRKRKSVRMVVRDTTVVVGGQGNNILGFEGSPVVPASPFTGEACVQD